MRWRTPAHWVALVLAVLLAMLSVIAIWSRNQVLDTDRYVETVAPLAREPSIQDLLVERLTAAIVSGDRAETLARNLLPERAQPLATPIGASVEGFVRETIANFVRSPRFAELWDGVSRRTHDAAVALLTGEDEGRLQIAGDRLVVRLGPLLGPAREAVVRAGLQPPLAEAGAEPEIVLGDASSIDSARGAVDLLQKLAWVLPVIGLICLAAVVFTAPDRRRGVLRAGMALVVAMALLAVGLGVGRSLYLDAVTGADLPEDAAEAAFDTLLRFLRDGVRLVFLVGLVIVLGAFVAGRAAGVGPVGRFVAGQRRALEAAAALIGMIVLLAQDRPTGGAVLVIGLAVLAFVVLVEFVAAGARAEPAS